ncbi:DUF4179 domain-containing protein [Bacillus sp. JJ1562]|uniref:DUF4179 domain-containing protein n=1 Tax=Bacillus sp. JJ1562 TaxID=3122960 RepID=UPI00300285DF
MIIAETDPVLIKMIRERDMEAIINWFEQRKDGFYKLAWTYLENLMDIQDVFYHVMLRVQTDIRKQKKNHDFDKWVISLFVEECKKRRLIEDLDDTLVLTYVLGLSQQEIAVILEISVESVKDRLYKEILSLSGAEGAHYQEKFIDYLSRSLDRSEKIELEIHLHTCPTCQKSLADFQNTIYSLIDGAEAIVVPQEYLDQVITELMKIEENKRKKKKKRTTIGVGVASSLFLLLLIGYVTNGFAYMYYSWLDWRDKEDEQLLAYLKNGIGEPLNLVKESNGIKITIKSAIGDEFQTLIYYEVENLKGEEQYGINFWNGVFVEDEVKIFDQLAVPINHLPVNPLESEEDIFKGTISLLPISSNTETIKLNIAKLQKMEKDAGKMGWIDFYGDGAFASGEWNFEIPVKKQASIEHAVEKTFTVDGLLIEAEKLIMAPTVTILQYRYQPYSNDKSINELFIEGIKTKEKTAKPAVFGWNFPVEGSSREYVTYQSAFDPLYFDDPKEVNLHLSSMSYFQSDFYNVDIDMNQPFPQTFEYLGSKISIDKVELGTPTKIELTAEMVEGRKFESLHFGILGQNDSLAMSMGISNIEGILVDRNGKIYDWDEYDYYANIDMVNKPRHYDTKMFIEVLSEVTDEEMIPSQLEIHGYQGTTYLDEVIKLKLK